MLRYAVFLRAINVGGRVVTMADLARYLRGMGFVEVETFIASGNVLLKSPVRNPSALAARLSEGLAARLGFQVDAFVRTDPELRRLTDRAATLQAELGGTGETNVCFLQAPLLPAQRTQLNALNCAMDSFVLQGTELYWSCRGRQSDSKFSNVVLEKKLRIKSTLRRTSMLQRLCLRLEA
jgi:uncharacterized protein (DUF1697 family)